MSGYVEAYDKGLRGSSSYIVSYDVNFPLKSNSGINHDKP